MSGDISVEVWLKILNLNGGNLTIINFTNGKNIFNLNLSPDKFNCNNNGFNAIYPYTQTNYWVYSACSILFDNTNLFINDLSLITPNDITTSIVSSIPLTSLTDLGQIFTYNMLNSPNTGMIYLAKDFKLWNYGMDLTQFYINKNK